MLTELCTLSFILLLHVMVESIEDVEIFVYLGSKVTKDGGTTQDVAQRIQKANGAFVQLPSMEKQ